MRRFVVDRNRFIADRVRGLDVLDVGRVNHEMSLRRVTRWLHEEIRATARTTVGLDNEPGEVQKMRGAGYDVVCADATSFDLARKFDAVVAGEVLEHLTNAGGFLRCARAHLRPGGRLLLSTPNAICLNYQVQNLLRGRELDNPEHVCLYTPTTLSALLAKCGFRVMSVTFYPESSFDARENRATYLARQWLQLLLACVRPSLCHHFITVAEVSGTEHGEGC